ncbi:MAG: response regulator [Butyrivibrio sp.]|nr:response regulator [Butyrivibrio sp.]
MSDINTEVIDYSKRLYFDEPELTECEMTDADVEAMSENEKKQVIGAYMNLLRLIYESDPVRISYSNTIIKIARSMNNIEFEGIGYFHMAIFFNASYKYYYRFRETMLQAVELLKNTTMYPALSSAYTLLGVDANNYGQYNLNLDYFLLARYYANLQNDPYIIALVHYFFSGFYIMVGDMDAAFDYALKSVEYYEIDTKRNSEFDYFGSDGMDMAYCMLGQCYIFKNQNDDAIRCYQKSLEREKLYTPSYDCPNTALIYTFHVMALHVSDNIAGRNKVVDEFIDILENHTPSPSFFLHIIDMVYYLIRIGEYEYALRINKIMIDSNIAKDNPNFGLYISNISIEISRHFNDENAIFISMQHFYDFYRNNNKYVFENLRRSTELRLEIDDIQKAKNDIEVAKAANKAKSNFLSSVSHEIRTPLNAILGMDEIIMRETKDDAIYNYAKDIKSAGNTLLGLINDILDFSKLDAGKINIIAVEYDISSAINDLINMVYQRALNKGLELKADIDENIPVFLYGDEIRVKQCVLNILTNAVKYTEKGSVTLKVSARKATDEEIDNVKNLEYINAEGKKLNIQEDRRHLNEKNIIALRFSVIDTGIGIKEEDIKKLAIPFERIEEEKNRNIEGTGLGMSIVRRLLDMMGSKLEVYSVYGEGSTFSFEVLQGVRSKEKLGNYSERFLQNQSRKSEFKREYIAPKARILIVDDTPANLTVAKGLLKPIGARIDTAQSGEETLKLVRDNKYDILFIDHRMPKMDGIETLKALKRLEVNLSKDAPCIALTANVISGAREMFLNEGFNDYLTKPIDFVKFTKMVRFYLPKELIEEAPDDIAKDPVDIAEGNDTESVPEDGDSNKKKILKEVQGMDLDAALKSCCDDFEILINTMRDFIISAKSQPEKIEEYFLSSDIKNYTILVHGLKSAARFVGALELSREAEYLEKCGDEGNIKEIEIKTPKLLSDFVTISENMERALIEIDPDKNEVSSCNEAAEDTESSKPVIDENALKEIYDGIKEFVSAYDFKSAEGLINMLQDYAMPEPDKERISKISDMVRNVDHDGILEMLK